MNLTELVAMAQRISPEQYAKAGTEHAEQVAVFIWANDEILAGRYVAELASLFAIPNGGLRSKVTAGRLKAEGVKSGVSDLFLPVPRLWYHGLFIEMKPLKTGRATDEQVQFIALMKSRGYGATVCRGWIEATQVIQSYLQLESS
jgi:VRR-NUC domain